LIVASADVLRSKGDYTAANSKYGEALRRNPQLSAALIGLAQTAIATGNDTDAQTYLAKALASDPANLAAKGQLGIVEGSRGDWESAVGHLRSAWEADQSNDEIGLELARALRHRGQVSQAFEILKRLDSRMSEVAPFHLELANLYAAMHRPADAEAERAIVANLESRAHQALRFQESQTYVF
jgi:thioredoxin-like negative regulator of GroEL